MPIHVFYPFFDYWLSSVLTDLQKVTICSGCDIFALSLCFAFLLSCLMPVFTCSTRETFAYTRVMQIFSKLSSGNFVVLSFICRIHIVLGIDIYEWCEVGI